MLVESDTPILTCSARVPRTPPVRRYHAAQAAHLATLASL